MPKADDSPLGLAIPIGILLIVLWFTGVVWILIPIFVLLLVFIGSVLEQKRIDQRSPKYDYWKSPDEEGRSSGYRPIEPSESQRPIYKRKEQKEEGVACGTVIPIVILLWLFLESGSWVFLIPFFFILASLAKSLSIRFRGSPDVKRQLERHDSRTVTEIADTTGVPEERVRRQIVREKRTGKSEIWFNPETGQTTPSPMRNIQPSKQIEKACSYCGFSLKSEDRFCPYCGAPIMAKD
jgi:hypothetical protein